MLDTGEYPTGMRYTRKHVEALPITKHAFHGDWNLCPVTHRFHYAAEPLMSDR